MKERPILFSSEMVRAILEGRKTQTRRVMKSQPPHHEFNQYPSERLNIKLEGGQYVHCPYGQPGDRLWVRETWMIDGADIRPAGVKQSVIYRASNDDYGKYFKWRPSIYMPRWASRITLEIVNVRVERLQEISEEDVVSEGIKIPVIKGQIGITLGMKPLLSDYLPNKHYTVWTQREITTAYFAQYWDSLNAKRGYSWESNPWVWVIEFKRLETK